MDLRMPVMDGVEATRQLRARLPETAVVVLTTHADDESVFSALRAGARGYLTKDAGATEIARAISVVAAGQACWNRPSRPGCWRPWTARRSPSRSSRRPGSPSGDRGSGPDRSRAVQQRDRPASRRLRGNREDAHQPDLRPDRCPRPGPGRRLRLPHRSRRPLSSTSTRRARAWCSRRRKIVARLGRSLVEPEQAGRSVLPDARPDQERS
jgi:hypothetical protein